MSMVGTGVGTDATVRTRFVTVGANRFVGVEVFVAFDG
jgi:hypothetical protein